MKINQNPYFLLYKTLGVFPRNVKLYKEALQHKSSVVVKKEKTGKNNERLEFLGDAILDAIVADILFHRFKKKREGFLTNTRSKIVQRETLNKIAIDMGLDRLIISSYKTTTHNHYIYGNALEALIGAIYLDLGYKKCKKFIEQKILKKYLDLENIVKKEVNFKSRLIEWGQKHKVAIVFDLIESFTDDEHNPIFQSRILIDGVPAGIGIGYTKKESQQNAARIALKKIRTKELLPPPSLAENSQDEINNTSLDLEQQSIQVEN